MKSKRDGGGKKRPTGVGPENHFPFSLFINHEHLFIPPPPPPPQWENLRNSPCNIVMQSRNQMRIHDKAQTVVHEALSDSDDDLAMVDDVFLKAKRACGSSRDTGIRIDFSEVDWSGKGICVRCKEGGDLLLCSELDCPVYIHEDCLGVPPTFDKFGNYICPHCLYKCLAAAEVELIQLVKMKKDALFEFLHRASDGNTEKQKSVAAEKEGAAASTHTDLDGHSAEHVENHQKEAAVPVCSTNNGERNSGNQQDGLLHVESGEHETEVREKQHKLVQVDREHADRGNVSPVQEDEQLDSTLDVSSKDNSEKSADEGDKMEAQMEVVTNQLGSAECSVRNEAEFGMQVDENLPRVAGEDLQEAEHVCVSTVQGLDSSLHISSKENLSNSEDDEGKRSEMQMEEVIHPLQTVEGSVRIEAEHGMQADVNQHIIFVEHQPEVEHDCGSTVQDVLLGRSLCVLSNEKKNLEEPEDHDGRRAVAEQARAKVKQSGSSKPSKGDLRRSGRVSAQEKSCLVRNEERINSSKSQIKKASNHAGEALNSDSPQKKVKRNNKESLNPYSLNKTMLSNNTESLNSDSLRKRVLWSDEEIQKLKEGYQLYKEPGKYMSWKKVLKFGEGVFAKRRSAGNLRDYWRTHFAEEI